MATSVQLESNSMQSPTSVDGQPPRFVYVQTFGCQMNVNDTDRIHQVLAPYNYTPTTDPAQANLILLNTCSVRDRAEHKMMSRLGRLAPLKEFNDDLILGVAGCVAQQEGEKLLAKVPYLDLVFGPDHVAKLPVLLDRVRGSEGRVSETKFFKRKDYAFLEAEPRDDVKVSEFVTIMKGCDKVCAFCIVPFTRGREVSKSPEMIIREVKKLVAGGAREITLLGQNVNSYGKDISAKGDRVPTFAQLLRDVDAIEGVERLRFTTSHPMDCIDDLIACFGDVPSLCEFFHLPVQSGSNEILEAMRRFYTRASYLARVENLRRQCPDIALSTDIIVGFPGETEAQFQDTLSLLAEVRYDSIFAFKYSERPGTRAAKMGDTVPEPEKKRRLAEVLELQAGITRAKMEAYVGQELEILVEGPSKKSSAGGEGRFQIMGRTRSNLIVNVPVPLGEFWSNRWIGRLAKVRVLEAKSNSLFGEFV